MGDASRRSLYKVTLSSIKPSADDERSGRIEKRQRGIEKIAFVGALRASAAELTETLASGDLEPDARAGLDVMRTFAGTEDRPRSRAAWAAIARVPLHELVAAARALARHRRNAKTQLTNAAKSLVEDHAAHLRTQVRVAGGTVVITTAPAAPPPAPTGGTLARSTPSEPVIAPYTGPVSPNPWRTDVMDDTSVTAASLRGSLGAAMDWARVNSPERANELTTLVQRVVKIDTSKFPGTDIANWDRATVDTVSAGEETEDWTDDLTDGFEERMRIEPIGRVHLERVDMTPVEVLRGELIHSENEVPPPITEVLDPKKLTDLEWPRDALLFVLENWLRIGLNQLLRAFDQLESDVKFAGKFRLATLLEIAGLSTSLDDQLAAQLAVKFAREFHSAVDLVEQ